MECVDFAAKHPRDFELVSTLLSVLPVMLCASDVSGRRRPRAFWCSFTISQLMPTLNPAWDVFEPGRSPLKSVLPTLMASGTNSWNTSKVVVDEYGQEGPLLTVEMERLMGLDDGYTDLDG